VVSVFDTLTSQWLKDRFLLGVDLTLDDGTAYPDGIYEQSIRGAVSWLEQELGIIIDPMVVESEVHDAYEPNRTGYWPFQLDRRPVWTLQKLDLRYGGFEPITMPVQWIQLADEIHGRVHLIPSEHDIGSFQFTSGVPIIVGDVFQAGRFVPNYFQFSYTAGFAMHSGSVTIPDGDSTTIAITFPEGEKFVLPNYTVDLTFTSNTAIPAAIRVKSKTRTEMVVEVTTAPAGGVAVFDWVASAVPSDILQAIGYKAALLPLDIAGDLIVGAGIASTSTSVDGLSQSINTTASATNSGYGARVLQFERELKSLIPALKARFGAPKLAFI